MNESKLDTIEQIREFLTGTADVTFSIPADESTLRAFVSTVTRRFGYFRLAKAQRGVLFAYLRRLTGYLRIPDDRDRVFRTNVTDDSGGS